MEMYTDEMGFKYQELLHDLQVSLYLFLFFYLNSFSRSKLIYRSTNNLRIKQYKIYKIEQTIKYKTDTMLKRNEKPFSNFVNMLVVIQ